MEGKWGAENPLLRDAHGKGSETQNEGMERNEREEESRRLPYPKSRSRAHEMHNAICSQQ